MSKRGTVEWTDKPKIKQILLVFSIPKTHTRAEIELSVKEIKIKPFLEKKLLICPNPDAKKGKIYFISDKAKRLLKISCFNNYNSEDWKSIGWIIASPRQRLALLRSVTPQKLTSEEIRAKATQLNTNITRISTKNILNELIRKHLVNTEVIERLRFYWLTDSGMKIKQKVAVIAPLSPAIFGA